MRKTDAGMVDMITLTETAQRQLERIISREGGNSNGIRLGVKGGGCSGFTYVMELEKDKRDRDLVINENRVPIFVDPKSLFYLDGLEIDYMNDLLNGGFKFKNPNATKSCGCGTSFSV